MFQYSSNLQSTCFIVIIITRKSTDELHEHSQADLKTQLVEHGLHAAVEALAEVLGAEDSTTIARKNLAVVGGNLGIVILVSVLEGLNLRAAEAEFVVHDHPGNNLVTGRSGEGTLVSIVLGKVNTREHLLKRELLDLDLGILEETGIRLLRLDDCIDNLLKLSILRGGLLAKDTNHKKAVGVASSSANVAVLGVKGNNVHFNRVGVHATGVLTTITGK
mmetsp:Transcript_13531/g.23298  ORF Transcript_13531/g.23298 Transcript_13531/m.23298 type:complete len:219 (+) Transcript_13531:359-1015(+)